MPVTGFLDVPDVAGESLYSGHEAKIDIFGVHWDVEQSAAAQVGRIRGRARAVRGPVVVHKFCDASSPYLALATHSGKVFEEVVLTLRKESGGTHLDYLVITMERAVFSAYEFANESPDGDDSQLMERMEIDSAKMTFKYIVQSDDFSSGAEHEVAFAF